jgi:hypothetical protein
LSRRVVPTTAATRPIPAGEALDLVDKNRTFMA